MSWTRRRLQVATAAVVVMAWAVVYLGVIAFAPPSYDPASETATEVNRGMALILAVPTAVYVVAALLVLHFWLAGAGARLSAMDTPGQLLAVAVATLPGHRRDWGAAMTAELAEVSGRRARWWFALSCARAALRLPPAGGWLAPALVAIVAAAATAAAGPAIGAAVPGLGVFAASFVGLIGVLAVMAVARARRSTTAPPPATTPAATPPPATRPPATRPPATRPLALTSRRSRFPALIPGALAAAGVASAIAVTVVLLLREPSVAAHLTPGRAVFLAAVLAGCLWLAVAPPRSLGPSRLAPYLAAGATLLFLAGQALAGGLATRSGLDAEVRALGEATFALLLFFGPPLLFFVPALWAAMVDRSFRSGVRAGAWTAVTVLPLSYALWVITSLRVYEDGGGVGFDNLAGPAGTILDDAVFWCLVFAPVVGVPCAVFGAAAAASLRPSAQAAQAGRAEPAGAGR